MSEPKEGTEEMVYFFGIRCPKKVYDQAIQWTWYNKVFKSIREGFGND